MVFFQSVLLIGYLYSHIVIGKLGISVYRYLHIILLFLPLLFFPGRPLPEIGMHQNIAIVLDIFWQLLFSIGLVFFVLATTSIIFQGWLAASELPEKSNPYMLYAFSNLGSFLALLSYPFFFETNFDLATQLGIWRACYLTLLILHIIVLGSVVINQGKREPILTMHDVGTKEMWRWFLLGAAGVIAFLSVTNVITYEITPAPLLWIIPLCIYLISFVLNFKARPFCPGWIKNKFYLITAFSLILFFLTQQRTLPFTVQIIAYAASLFFTCMFCQNELAKSKPANTHGLTIFYLTIASGSFVGGVLVTWVAPLAFKLPAEYLLSFFIIYSSLIMKEKNSLPALRDIRFMSYVIFILMLWPVVFNKYNIFGIVILFLLMKFIYTELKNRKLSLCLSLLSIIIIAHFIDYFWTEYGYIYTKRNYYGIYKIYDNKGIRFFLNGTTLHGAQYISIQNKNEPLTYYHRKAPVGEFIESPGFKLRKIGIVGLGVGTLAAYGRQGQDIDFFELDPEIFYIANKYFDYLRESQAKTNYIFGDARVMIKEAPHNYYDLLVIDAFSGDSVPVHLLTAEAIAEYKKHITKDGVILFHISNRYLDLLPVLFSNAKVVNARASFKHNRSSRPGFLSSLWVAFTWDDGTQQKLISELKWKKRYQDAEVRLIKPWTDQYSNILTVLKLQQFLDGLKEFQPFYW